MNITLINLYDSLPREHFVKGRYTHLALSLVESGHKVTWYSSNFHHGSKTLRDPDLEERNEKGLHIKLLPTKPYKRNMGFGRLYSDYLYSRRISRELTALHKRSSIDLIIVSLGPIFTPSIVTKVAKRLSIRSIADVQDIYPAAILALLPKHLRRICEYVFFPLKLLVRNTLRRSTGMTSLSKGRLNQVLKLHGGVVDKPYHPIYLNIKGNPAEKSILSGSVMADHLIMLFIGTVGSFYDFQSLFAALDILKKKGLKIEFHLIGDGPKILQTKILAENLGLTDIHFHGFIPFDQCHNIMKLCNIGIVPMAPDWPSCIPNKPIDYMSLGLPLISSIEGEMEDLITNYRLGYHYQPGKPKNLASMLELANSDLINGQFMEFGQNSLDIARDMFTVEKTMEQFEELIAAVNIEDFK